MTVTVKCVRVGTDWYRWEVEDGSLEEVTPAYLWGRMEIGGEKSVSGRENTWVKAWM